MEIEELIEGFKRLSQSQQHEVVNELYKHLIYVEKQVLQQ